jgi:hypothetical protein
MCQSKSEGGKRCHPQPGHPLFNPAGFTRRGLNGEDSDSIETLAELQREGQAWRDKLTEDESDEVYDYQATGYLVVNAHLRGDGQEEWNSRAARYIKHLDSAIAKAPKAPKERILYRSIFIPKAVANQPLPEGTTKKNRRDAWIDSQFEPGAIVEFPEYLSTSVDSDLVVRTDKTKTRHKGNHAVLEIISKSGAVLHQDSRRASYGVQDDEKEILLPRNMKFRVVKVFREVEFESTYKHGVDNRSAHLSYFKDRDPDPRVKSRLPVIQLIEVEE